MLLRYLAAVPKIELNSISFVKIDENSDNILDKLEEKVIIEGYVTVVFKAESNGNLSNDFIYVQDETSGIEVCGVIESKVKLGQKIRVTGRVNSEFGNAQIKLEDEKYDLEIIDENINLIAPIEISTFESIQEKNEGILVKTIEKIISIVGNTIYINDGSGEVGVYINDDIEGTSNYDLKYKEKLNIKIGDVISTIGIVVESNNEHILMVRDLAEIVNINEGIEEDSREEQIPEIGEKPKVEVNLKGNGSNKSKYSEINKEKDDNNSSNKEKGEYLLSDGIDKSNFFLTITLIIVIGNVFVIFKNEKS